MKDHKLADRFLSAALITIIIVLILHFSGWNRAEAFINFSSDTSQDLLASRLLKMQKNGEFEAALIDSAKLDDNHPLAAHVALQRLTDSRYKAANGEKMDWLRKHVDLPIASMLDPAKKRKNRMRPSDIKFIASPPSGWKTALHNYSQGRFALAGEQFERISHRRGLSAWYESGAHYWHARSLEAQGVGNQSALRSAATHQHTFYGQLAASALSQTEEDDDSFGISNEAFSDFTKRVNLLHDADIQELLKHEIAETLPLLNNEQKAEFESLAKEQKIDSALIPSPNTTKVSGYNVPEWFPYGAIRMDQSLVLGIIRQESKFNPNARNPQSGASGLMQLLPDTARYVVRRYRLNEVKLASLEAVRISPVTENRIRDPKANIIIGQHYLSYLAGKSYIDGNLIHTLAAYNAGPANVIKWQKRFAHIDDPLLFAEMIPFRETRQYVIQVLANHMYYDTLAGNESDVAASLLKNRWPHITPL